MKKPLVVLIDDNLPEEDPLIIELKFEHSYPVELFKHSQDGLAYILDNLDKEIIVVLDIEFSPSEINGYKVLELIREQDKLIPVIIWSAKNGNDYNFTDFVNNHAMYYVEQTDDTADIINRIEDAYHHLKLDIATNIEMWLEQQDDKEQVISIDAVGKTYTAKELAKEIRMQNEYGRQIEEEIIQLTIDLLFRNQEKI